MPAIFGRRCTPLRIITFLVILAGTILGITTFSTIPISIGLPIDSFERLENTGKKTLSQLTPLLPGNWQSGGSGGAHKPPEAITNSTSSTKSWYEHWTWLNPWVTSEDYSESRTVLPPLKKRCPIYAYYDQDVKKTGKTSVDNAVMLAWRRAWWAAGFEPIILSLEDARQHGAYPKLMADKRGERLAYNLLRWLAWDRMGTGILSDYRVFPMPTPNDPVLEFLRRCDYGEYITRFDGLGTAIFAGSGPAIKYVVSNATLWKNIPTNIMSPADLAADQFITDPKPASLAYYSREVVSEKYKGLELTDLPNLINVHLHNNFFLQHATINVINPVEPESDAFSLPSYRIAEKLASCPQSPLPQSCPPQMKECTPCSSNTEKIQLSRRYKNQTDIFNIGGIPHPLTMEGILYDGLVQQLSFIRRNSTRDAFLKTITPEIAPEHAGAMFRAVKLKEIIAETLSGNLKSLWSTTEDGFDEDQLEWMLGFKLPPETDQPNSQLRQTVEELEKQKQIIEHAKHAIKATTAGLKHLRDAVEAWSLADFEIWKFVTAFEQRRVRERLAWAEREKEYGKGTE